MSIREDEDNVIEKARAFECTSHYTIIMLLICILKRLRCINDEMA